MLVGSLFDLNFLGFFFFFFEVLGFLIVHAHIYYFLSADFIISGLKVISDVKVIKSDE